jgi:O-antigen ligase
VFPEHPLLGAGAGTYGVLLQDAGYHANPAHNLFIGLLVEQGIIGLSAFVALLVAAASTIRRMPPFERKTWGVLMLSFALTLLSQSLERWKVTWLLLAMLAARNEIGVARSYPSRVPVRASIDAIPVKPT